MGFGYAVYFTERLKNRVIRWEPDSGDVQVVAGRPNERGNDQCLSEPYGLAIDTNGTLLIADKKQHRVCQVINGHLTPIDFVDPHRHRARRPGLRRTYSETRPHCPTALFMEPSGSFLCTFSDEHTIYRIHSDGRLELVLGIPPNRHFMFMGYDQTVPAQQVGGTPLMMPTGIVELKDGTIFFIERMVQAIRKYVPGGELSGVFPMDKHEDFAFRADVPDRLAIEDYHPAHPGSLALDSDDVLYLSESQHGCVLKVDFKSGDVLKVIQASRPGKTPGAGPAAMEFGPDGTAWVLNTTAGAVEAFAPSAKGVWKPTGVRLTQIEGKDLSLPDTGSGLVLGN